MALCRACGMLSYSSVRSPSLSPHQTFHLCGVLGFLLKWWGSSYLSDTENFVEPHQSNNFASAGLEHLCFSKVSFLYVHSLSLVFPATRTHTKLCCCPPACWGHPVPPSFASVHSQPLALVWIRPVLLWQAMQERKQRKVADLCL